MFSHLWHPTKHFILSRNSNQGGGGGKVRRGVLSSASGGVGWMGSPMGYLSSLAALHSIILLLSFIFFCKFWRTVLVWSHWSVVRSRVHPPTPPVQPHSPGLQACSTLLIKTQSPWIGFVERQGREWRNWVEQNKIGADRKSVKGITFGKNNLAHVSVLLLPLVNVMFPVLFSSVQCLYLNWHIAQQPTEVWNEFLQSWFSKWTH